MQIGLHSQSTMHCNLLTDIRIAKETGHAGIDIHGGKLRRYLAQGYGIESLLPLLSDCPAVGIAYIGDIERQEPAEYAALLKECEEMCTLAEKLSCPMVQLLTGPLNPYGTYKGLTGRPWPEMRDLTAKNLKKISEIGRAHKVKFFLEAMTWTPLHKLEHQLELLDVAGCDNIGLVVDFWHMWDSGATADQISKLNKEIIYLAHFADSLEQHGQRGTFEQHGRDLWPGSGNIPLKEWVDAVRATGFDGWWFSELLSPKHWELDPWKTARDLKTFLEYFFVTPNSR